MPSGPWGRRAVALVTTLAGLTAVALPTVDLPAAEPVSIVAPAPEPTPEQVAAATVERLADGWLSPTPNWRDRQAAPAEVVVLAHAAARPVPRPAGPPPDWLAERRGAVLALIDYDWRALGFRIEFLGPRPGLRGMSFPKERLLQVYARPSDTVAETAFDLAHEIGHAVDHVHGTRARRDEWSRRRGFSGTAWYPCDGCEDLASGAGDYAEVFAYWQVGDASQFRSRLAGVPSAAELRELVPLMMPAKGRSGDGGQSSGGQPGGGGQSPGQGSPPPSGSEPSPEPSPSESEERGVRVGGVCVGCG